MVSLKKSTMFLALLLIFSASALGNPGKDVEVMYFKAKLACCKARACNALQSDVEKAVSKYSKDNDISFKVIRLNDSKNKELIEKYNAKSQTVVIYNKENDKAIDVTSIVKSYLKDQNKEKLENELKKKIDEILKS